MLFLVGCLVGLLAGLAAGGNLAQLATVRLRWPVVVIAALLIKEAGVYTPLAGLPWTPVLFVVSLAVLVLWAAYHAYQLPALWLVVVGMASNLLVVAANGGRIPAYRGTPQLFVQLKQHPVGEYVLGNSDTPLGFLGDWISLPGPAGNLFPQGYSPGDVAIFIGLVIASFIAIRPLRRKGRAGAAGPPNE
jgi:hypothetical protein